MIRLIADTFGWTMDADGTMLTVRTPKARQIIDELKPGKYAVEIKAHRKKRTLDQNALYWATLGDVANALSISIPKAHNLMLRRYGAVEAIDGKTVKLVLPDTDEAAERADEAESYHIKPTSQVKAGNDGTNYRTYLLLKGSHEMDTAEMTRLIDGLMDEAKQMGIEPIWEE